jgi:FMN phosphatase YigB (HAD superfamily)
MQSLDKPLVLFDIDYTLFDTAHFKATNLLEFRAYDEVPDVLATLSKTTILGIFSEGEEEFQIMKLKKTNIYDFFDKDHIYVEILKKAKIKLISEKYVGASVWVIDDKLPILALMKSALPMAKTVWIRRGEYAMNQKPVDGFNPDVEIDTLSELRKLIVS